MKKFCNTFQKITNNKLKGVKTMTLKMKLISMISAFMLVLGLMLVGIYAVNQISVDFGGNISFTATDVYARVTGEISNAGVGSQTLPTLNFDADMTDEEVETEQARWSGLNLAFDEDATPITIEVTVENLSSSHSLRVNLTDNTTSNENLEIAYQQDGEEYINGNDITLPKSTGDETSKTTYLITFSIPNPNFSLPSTDFSIDINLYDESYVPPLPIEVTNVQINDSTPTTTSEYNGQNDPDEVIDLSNIQFETGETEVVISMTSLNANYIKNNVSWVNNDNVTITSTSLYLPKNQTGDITGGESRDLKITVTNNSGSPTTIEGLEVAFEEKEDLLQATADGETSSYTREGYWYVEMGTYSTTSNNEEGKRESEYLRWRYFSDTSTHYEFDRNTRPTGEGYFILETWIQQFKAYGNATDLGVSWNNDYKNTSGNHQLNGWTDIDANDYSTSTIRQYINGNTVKKLAANQSGTYVPSGALTNMFECFNIDPDNDIIYTDIIGRTLGDLYTDMTDATTDPQDVTMPKGSSSGWEGAEITYSEDDTDKFWLLSYYEAYTLLSGNATTSSDTDRKWGGQYWLRSPNPSYSSNNAYHVSTSGFLSDYYVYLYINVARAAFKFSVDNIA